MNPNIKVFDQAVLDLTRPGQLFAIDQVEVGGTQYKNFATLPVNLGAYFDFMLEHGDRDFLVYEGKRYSFLETYRLAASLASTLKEDFGIIPGDRVVIFSRNNPEWIISFISIAYLGAISVPINAWWTFEELDYGVADSGSSVILVDEERLDVAIAVAKRNKVKIIPFNSLSGRGEKSFWQIISSRQGAKMPKIEVASDDPATLFYTSGSTGNPKGVLSSHRGILSALMSWMLMGSATKVVFGNSGAKTQDKFPPAALLALPLFHVAGSHSSFLLSIVVGRKLVIMHSWDPMKALKLIQEERITTFNGVPTMSAELQVAAKSSGLDFSSLIEIYAGGAARPASQVEKIANTFVKASPGIGYGLTETNGLGALNSGKFYISKPGSTGRTVPPVTDIRIVNKKGEAVEPGVTGEILIKSPANFMRYWNNPEASAKALVDGWFHTGDIGYLDEEGFLFVVDRIKDIIIRGGENISCFEVESAIYAYDGIRETSVFGLPDDRLGEVVAATVHLNENTVLDEEDLRLHLSKLLAAYKMPKYIFQRDTQLPRTGSQKIARRELRIEYEKFILEGSKENQ